MRHRPSVRRPPLVALLAEGVDRNLVILGSTETTNVALLAEGVDRNTVTIRKEATAAAVALLAEGVDRNPPMCAF